LYMGFLWFSLVSLMCLYVWGEVDGENGGRQRKVYIATNSEGHLCWIDCIIELTTSNTTLACGCWPDPFTAWNISLLQDSYSSLCLYLYRALDCNLNWSILLL
jgi:hypothetical protein